MDLDLLLALRRIDGRRGRQQGLRVRVQRVRKDRGLGAGLHHTAEVHHHHVVGDVLDHRQVVRDKHVGGLQLFLQVHEQVEHLRLDRHVQRRGGLVGHQDLGLQHHGARDGDALALAAREHVGVAVVVLGPQAHALQGVQHLLLAIGR